MTDSTSGLGNTGRRRVGLSAAAAGLAGRPSSLWAWNASGWSGLPNSGKSSLFNALTGGSALVASHPFSTTETSVGVAQVPDHRLDALATMSSSQQGRARQRRAGRHRRPGGRVVDR